MRVIHPKERVRWDVFCSLVIIVSAFAIPYDLFVGWTNVVLHRVFNVFVFAVFLWDMVLNCRTIQPRSTAGFWGWRHVAGIFNKKWGVAAARRRVRAETTMLTVQEDVLRGYLTSVWFPIDLLATIPWNLMLTGATWLNFTRPLKLLRAGRLVRLLRLSKSIRFVMQLRRLAKGIPSLERIVFTLLLIPWCAHLHACLFYYFESQNPNVTLSYSDALHAVFVSFTTGDEANYTMPTSFWVSVSAVVFQVLLIGAVTGNIAAILTGIQLQRKPRPDKLRAGHTIILGWGNTIFSVLSQLTSEDEGSTGDIVIMADLDVQAMWDAIGLNCPYLLPGIVDVQRGSPCFAKNIRDMNISMAKQVLIFGEEHHDNLPVGPPSSEAGRWRAESHDAQVLKSILACCSVLRQDPVSDCMRQVRGGASADNRIPVVAAVQFNQNSGMLKQGIPEAVKRNVRLNVVATTDTLTRCISQAIADPHLAPVFRTLLSYDETLPGRRSEQSSEVYCLRVGGGLLGRTFQECMLEFPRAIPIGYIVAETASSPAGESGLVLNPPPNSASARYAFREGDRIVVVAEARSDATWCPYERPELKPFSPGSVKERPRKILLFGGRLATREVLRFLPEFLPHNSAIHTSASSDGIRLRDDVALEQIPLANEAVPADGQAVGIVDMVHWAQVESLTDFDTIALVADLTDVALHDDRILMALAGLCAKASQSAQLPSIVTGLFDPDGYELARPFGEPAVIVLSELVSNYMVQLALDPDRGLVFGELLDPRGNEIYTRPVECYLNDDSEHVSFDEIRTRAFALHETAIGYCPPDRRAVRLCPHERTTAMRPSEFGRIVVIAREFEPSLDVDASS